MAYIRGVDYKGLNESVTSVIYHMTRNIECICRQTMYKHHAYTTSTTHPVYFGVSVIRTYAQTNDKLAILSI
jgi:hypothetical protein